MHATPVTALSQLLYANGKIIPSFIYNRRPRLLTYVRKFPYADYKQI